VIHASAFTRRRRAVVLSSSGIVQESERKRRIKREILAGHSQSEGIVQRKDALGDSGVVGRVGATDRKTRETDISVRLDLDGSGKAEVDTGLGFFDHMLELMARHGLIDVSVRARGDLQTGGHHTVEDVGICLGSALSDALGEKSGITRYGSVIVPMDESLAMVVLDLSGRPYLAYEGGPVAENIAGFDSSLVSEFLRAFVNHARLTLHVRILTGGDVHHTVEAVFKGLGKALRQAVSMDERSSGVPSTKGVL
jgi:imidazoleglycerol-phosphate dehydratase